MGFSQNIAVQSFAPDESDQSARITGKRTDANNKTCAIVKIETPLKLEDITFDAGMVGIEHSEQKTGEIWVWLSPGAQRLTIIHKDLGSVRNYEFGAPLKEATVYVMKLKSGTVERVVTDDVALQYFVVNCPIDGVNIKIDGNASEAFSNGTFQKLLSYGKHQYTIEAPMYYPLSGQIEIKASEKSYLTPDLKPAFAVITLTGDGDIYINDEEQDVDSWSGRLMPGTYKVEVKKASHRTSVASIEVKAGENKTIPLQAPMPIYGSLNISTNVVDAAIVIDGVKQKETTPALVKNVLIGKHSIELQAKDYKSNTQIVEVQEGKIADVNAALQKMDKLATLKVFSNIPYVYVLINGENVGQTPLTKENLPLGKTKVFFSKDGYKPQPLKKTIVLKPGYNEIRGELKSEYTSSYKTKSSFEPMNFFFIDYRGSPSAPIGIAFGAHSGKSLLEFGYIQTRFGSNDEYLRLSLTAGGIVRLIKNSLYLYGGLGWGYLNYDYDIDPDDTKEINGLEWEIGATVMIKSWRFSLGYNKVESLGEIHFGIGTTW
ncbi:hypothetical protein AGMMS4957_02720 [Bacteroidia bacterium]|nr:hypothetical protein AGMMS4957_02720 [Bacteroidia bacterium]